jgi:hypothetical protein
MLSATFIGEVQQGRLHFGQTLAEFEGKKVLVTLIVPDSPLPASIPPASLEAEILEDCGRIQAKPRALATVTAEIVAVGRPTPRLSVEEE